MLKSSTGIVGLVFSAIGTISLAVAAVLGFDLHEARTTWGHATGHVVDERCGQHCRPVVEFQAADGSTYAVTAAIGSSWREFDPGAPVDVLYQPDNPRESRIDSPLQSYFGICFGLGFFAIFGGIGYTFLFLALRRLRGARWARDFGQSVQAEFIAVERDRTMTVNGRQPFRVMAQWQNPRDRKVYRFESEPMWIDPSRYMTGHPRVTVKLDPDDPKHRYWMDLAFLPKAA